MKSKFLRLKRVAFALLILLLSVTGVKTTNAQNTVGTDFWVTFLPNYEPSDTYPLTLSLIATSSTPCSGTITNPYTNWSTSFEVSVGATTIIDIPSSEAYSDDDSDSVVNIGLHIVTTDSISLFASNFRPYTFDVTDVLPTYSLGSNYIIQTYNEANRSIAMSPSSHTNSRSDGSCSEFTVLAVEDNTTVYITLTDNSMNGHYANQTFSMTLNAGQCYQIKSINGGDFSGSQVSVSGNKRVAVFAGNRCTNIPYGCYACDHIVEQMMPVSCWGNHFVVTNSTMRDYDVVRVTAANNGCQIFINGSLVTTINQKQTYQFEITSNNPSMYLETSEPAMVYLYYVGSECAGEMGDPSMVMISPIEQRMDYVTFSTFNSGASQYHYVNVVTNTDDVTSVQLDGNSIASEFQTVSGNSGYSFARVAIEHGSHTLFTTGGGFVAHVYGLGDDESYAYSVGSNAVQELYTNMLVNGQTVSGDMDVCGNTVGFDLNYNYNLSQVNWTFGDGQTGSGIPVTHEYANEGDYAVSCNVYKLNSLGQDSLVATLSTVLHIYDTYESELSVTSYGSYSWMGNTYTVSGDYVYEGQTIHGCDSIITLHLTIPTLQVIAEYSPDVNNPHSPYVRVYWNEFAGGAPFEAQIGEGTTTFNYFPFYTFYNYSIGENLFLASELEEAGVTTAPMTSLSWYATNAPGYEQQGISIWMANVDDEALTSTSHVVTDMTLVYTGAMTPEIGWNEFVFNEGTFAWNGYSNILIYCQRNNGVYNSSVKWQATSSMPFTASTYKYQDSAPYDPTVAQSMNTSSTRPDIIMKSDGSRTENLTYRVYRANCDGSGVQQIANNITENQYIDIEWPEMTPGNYKYGVSVVDGRGNVSEIHWNNTPVIPNHHTIDASVFLDPVTSNNHLGEPSRVNYDNGWIYYDDGSVATSIGTGGGVIYWASMFPSEILSSYAGENLTKVALFENDYNTQPITLNIYLGGTTAPETLVSTMDYNPVGGGAFNEVTLSTPVAIDGTQNLWIVFSENGTYPANACVDTGDPNNRWVSLNGNEWMDVATAGVSGYGWMIRGYVGSGSEITWSNCIGKPGNSTNSQSTVGNDFWVTFLPNDSNDNNAVYMSLIASGSLPCTGTITNPYTNWSTSFEVSVGATTIIDIPLSEAYSLWDSDCILNTGLHVETTEDISLYASNFMAYSFDVADVLPTPSLGSNYIIQVYPGMEGSGTKVSRSRYSKSLSNQCSEFSVLAVEDNTTVYITLTENSSNGHYANQPFSVTLNAGQCYQVKSIPDGDFSGSQVSVSGNKKVAVFAGNECANIPSDCAYCDHIVEQMMPVACWGNHFVVTGSSWRTFDIVRVTAANNGCQIFINNSLVTTINQRETYQFEITSDDPSMYLETSEPAMVYLYYAGSECAGEMGDPSMVIISPIEQRMDYVTFSTFNSGASQYHFVNIVTNTDDVSSILLDGNSIASEFQTVSGNSGYSYARVSIEHGSHTLFTSGNGFVAHVYGLGDDESYAYSVGSNAIQDLYTNVLVNGQTVSGDMDVCGKTVTFDLNYNYDVSQVNWTFGDGQTGSGIPVTHEYANLGDYAVSCTVYKLNSLGQDSLVATLSTVLHIYDSYESEFSVTSYGSYSWMGQTYIHSGDYVYEGQTIHGCDSIVTLHLTITALQVIAEYYPDVNDPNSPYVRVYWDEFTGGAPFEAQIGEGTSTNGYLPFYCFYNYSLSQQLFTAGELEEAGVTTAAMTSLSWNCTATNNNLQSNITIWMANVEETAVNSASPLANTMTKVYEGDMTPVVGWNEFVFNVGNFAWDGQSSVLICVQRNTGAWASGVNWQVGAQNFTAGAYKYSDIEGPYDMENNSYSMTTTSSRANIIMKADGSRTENLIYRVYRANCDGTEMQQIADNVAENQYIDTEWTEMVPGNYKYGVSIVSNGREGAINWVEPVSANTQVHQPLTPEKAEAMGMEICHASSANSASTGSREMWDLMATFYAAEGGHYGVAYDGDNFYTSNWGYSAAAHNFYKYDLQGNVLEGFEISGCGTLRGITYDGTYFYGVANSSTVYCVDLANHTLINTFTSSYGAMRGITYDPVRDGFWVIGNWSGNLTLIDHTGAIVQVGPEPTSASDLAYYKDENNVEHVYCFNNGDNGVYDYNITTNTLEGSVFNFSNTPGYENGTSGGCTVGNFNGKMAFIGDIQQSPNLIGIYELGDGYGQIFWSNCIVKPSSSTSTQILEFAQGYNWWSTYIEQNNIDGLGMLQNGLGGNGVSILSQADGYSDYYEDYGWYGSLESINNESSYKVLVNEPCTVTMSGNLALPSSHPITLNQGWTWIGYVSSTVMDVNTAMSGMESTYGDRLKSHQYFAEYYPGYGWFGSLNTIVPGTGLMYYSSNSQPVAFTYPVSAKGGELKANLTAENNHWVPNTYAYPDNMTVMAVVELDDEELSSDTYELAAFDANGECRGSVQLVYAEPLSRYVAFLTISGKDATELSFRLYDTETGMEYYDAEESFSFVANTNIGNASELYVIHFRGTTGVNEFANRVQVYPNPVAPNERFSIVMNTESKAPVRVEIVNALGAIVSVETSTQNPVVIVAPTTAGVYTMRIITEDKGTAVCKLIVR